MIIIMIMIETHHVGWLVALDTHMIMIETHM